MKCIKCKRIIRGKKEQHDYSAESFGGVFVQVTKYDCKYCKHEFKVFPDDREINKEICNAILNQGEIKREQIMYIQENVFCESVFEFAKRIKTNPQHLKKLILKKAIMSQEISDSIAEQIIKHFGQVSIRFE